MRIKDLEYVISKLNIIKGIGDLQDYNTSTAINKEYNEIHKVLQEELDRLNSKGIDIDGPQLCVIDKLSTPGANTKSLVETLNNQIEKLIKDKYKIIDFGLVNDSLAYIKYTT